MLIHFVAWALAKYPDSNFIYCSYSHTLAKKQTQTIRDILQNPHYKTLFEVSLKEDTTAKDNFETSQNGSVYAVGSGGSITGRGAGIKNVDRFGGAIILDDALKADEASSETIREGINQWFYNTLQSRVNTPNTAIIIIGQRLHEHDICAFLAETGDWERLIIPSIDVAGNALYPEMHDLQALKRMQELSPYEFAAQYQQDPQPAGGGIFKPEWFILHDFEPLFIATFVTVDTAETDKTWNDATVFSFWGMYKPNTFAPQDTYALHCIDCLEIRVEPKDLEANFKSFYMSCMSHKVKPQLVAIEKKSTGVTLASVLKGYQGMPLFEIERTKAGGSKTERFLGIQQVVSQGLISLPTYGKHTPMVIEHMRKITANNSHRFDDICDTVEMAVDVALRRKVLAGIMGIDNHNPNTPKLLGSAHNQKMQALKGRFKAPFR